MESKDELKEIDIKNRMCYYFQNIIKIEDFNFDKISTDEKSYEIILFYSISNKTLIDAKPLHITFATIDEFIRFYDGTIYLVLFGSEKHDFSYIKIRYFIGVKSCITYVISDNYAKIKVDSFDSLPLERKDFS